VRSENLPVPDFLDAAGGLREWRKHACLAEEEAVMEYGRTFFSQVASEPITKLDFFSEAAGRHLQNFVGRNYSNFGFGAKFSGYEGLDPDGVRLVANTALVADRPMLQAYEQAEEREEQGEQSSTSASRPRSRTLDKVACSVRPNAAYMLSLVQGVRAHSVHNLKRFESFHDRVTAPNGVPEAVHALTGCRQLAADNFRFVRGDGPGSSAEAPHSASPGADVVAEGAD
jgi:hypothetical protein